MKAGIWTVFGLVVVAVGGCALLGQNGQGSSEIEYRYSKAEKGELIRSISATGQLVALTTVDVKSKAGGKIVKLYVEEGSEVGKGDLIAEIDPSDTRATYDQASADLQGAQARARSAGITAQMTAESTANAVRDAENNLALAQIRAQRAAETARSQPTLTSSAVQSATANLKTQQEAMTQIERVTIPQLRKDSETTLNRTKAELDTTQAELDRQRGLLEKGYVAGSAVERARSAYEAARAAHEQAQTRAQSLNSEIQAQVETQRSRVQAAAAGLRQARANGVQDTLARRSLDEARKQVNQARIALNQAKIDRQNAGVRQADAKNARTATVRSRVAVQNAKVQLDSTKVVAPRSGVVTLKYLEEGTIIPPGTSTFAQGTSIVQISDTTSMYVECLVDEADIAQVRVGQPVRMIVEAFPRAPVTGTVSRINPAATTNANITTVKVRVQVNANARVRLLPGMNVTCEFITLSKPEVLLVPAQAVQRTGRTEGTVKVKGGKDGKPIVRKVGLGETGNDGVEVVSGLQPGEEVVVAEINMAEIRETQKRMQEAQAGGGGLTGGGPQMPRAVTGGGGGRGGASGSGGARGAGR